MTTPSFPSEPPVVTDNTASEPSNHGAQTVHRFATHWGFVLASVGSAVGMANVWGFPYKLGNNGGGAFLLIYIFFVVLFTYVGLPAEFANGRRARTGTLGTYRSAWATRGDRAAKVGSVLGWLPLAGSLCIAIGYAVIVAYVCKALFDSLTGTLMKTDTEKWFDSFSGTGFSVVPFHIIVVVGTLITLFLGAKSIEKTNRIMMPVFFIIFVILAIRVALMPGVVEGYIFMLTPRWEALINPIVWVWAMGQAFFSLSITGSGMIVYGAYLPDDEDVVKVSQRTGFFDTLAAVVAALVIIPACFAYNTDVGAGPGLLFVTLPAIMQDIPLGQLFAVILYVAMIFAGVSSLQNMFEAVGESLLHRFPRLNRTVVLVGLCVLALGAGLGMEAISSWGPWMDLVSIYIIPLGASVGAITWFWVMKKDELLEAINRGAARPRGTFWLSVGRFVYVPLAIILCAIALIGKVAF
nr:sodium-dependent transporter [uncultured Mobiluncus sp.]